MVQNIPFDQLHSPIHGVELDIVFIKVNNSGIVRSPMRQSRDIGICMEFRGDRKDVVLYHSIDIAPTYCQGMLSRVFAIVHKQRILSRLRGILTRER